MPRRSSPYGTTWTRLRLAILDRDGHTCQIAGPGCTHYATHVDHITSVKHGGTNDPANLRAACVHCNTSRGAKNGNAARSTGYSWP